MIFCKRENSSKRKTVGLPGQAATGLGGAQAVSKERRIGDYNIIMYIGIKILQGSLRYMNTVRKGRAGYILSSLRGCVVINLNGIYHSLRKALRHHQRYDPRARADIQDTVAAPRPSTQEHAIGAYFHGTMILRNSEFLKLKTITHVFSLLFFFSKRHLHSFIIFFVTLHNVILTYYAKRKYDHSDDCRL